MRSFVNLMPSAITVLRRPVTRTNGKTIVDGSYIVYPSQAEEYPNLDISTSTEYINSNQEANWIDNVYVQPVLHKIVNLPEPEQNTYFIVPFEVAVAHRDRSDLVFPLNAMEFNRDDINDEFPKTNVYERLGRLQS